jgi:site-specific DNA-cytosine methylase
MDFVVEEQMYSVTPQLMGVLNGFPIDYQWGEDRAQAAAGIGNAVVPRMAEILGRCLL